MTLEKNQNAELPVESSQDLREEKQQLLKKQISELKNLEHQLQNQTENKKENPDLIQISSSLSRLEERVDNLDLRNQETFDIQVDRIEQELESVRTTRSELLQLGHQVGASYQSINKQLIDHDPLANAAREQSIKNILSIEPKDGETSVANWAARRIQRLSA